MREELGAIKIAILEVVKKHEVGGREEEVANEHKVY